MVGIFLIAAPPVGAAQAQPSALQIQSVYAYENAGDTGVQCYIITYYIDFDTLPDENVDDLFIFRLLDTDDSEITSSRPFPFYNQGYELGAVAFYLDPEDAPTWESAVSVQLLGDPLVDWDGSTPETETASIVWFSGTVAEIIELTSARVIYLATDLEQAWSVEMTTTTQGTTVLSDNGAAYFVRTIPNLQTVAPYCLGQYVFAPQYPTDKTGDMTYAEQLERAVDGTIFDVSPVARSWGISRGVLIGAVYYGFFFLVVILLAYKGKLVKGHGLLLWVIMIVGAFIGVPLIATILCGLAAVFSTAWVFHSKSTS